MDSWRDSVGADEWVLGLDRRRPVLKLPQAIPVLGQFGNDVARDGGVIFDHCGINGVELVVSLAAEKNGQSDKQRRPPTPPVLHPRLDRFLFRVSHILFRRKNQPCVGTVGE